MKALIGLNKKKAKEVAKKELGVKRMGDARFQMILDEGIKRGDFIVEGDTIKGVQEQVDVMNFFEGLEEKETPVKEEPNYEVKTKTIHPEVAHIDPKLSSSDLPRPGDMYYYRSYKGGEIVQGEVQSTICFVECQNSDGTWQSVAFQDLYLKKKGIPKETMLDHLRAYYQNNNHLISECKKLDTERNKLLKEISDLESKVKELNKNAS